jgi:hypothetical protein
MSAGEVGGSTDQAVFSLHPEQTRLAAIAAEADGVSQEDIHRTALALYFITRASEDEGFAREFRASARTIWAANVALLREALGPVTVVAEDRITYPAWMREPEGDEQSRS